MTLSNPAQYISGRTVQEQMNSLIDYVDQRAAEVATDAIASDVAQVHSDAADAHTDALAAAASASAAAGTLANAVKKTGEASQSIAGDIAVAGALSGGSVSSSGNVDGASIGSGTTPITAGDLTAYGNVSLDDTTLQGNLAVADPSALINLSGAGSVVVPTPTSNNEAATKKYVDDADALKISITDVNTYAVGVTGSQQASGVKTWMERIDGILNQQEFGATAGDKAGYWFKVCTISANIATVFCARFLFHTNNSQYCDCIATNGGTFGNTKAASDAYKLKPIVVVKSDNSREIWCQVPRKYVYDYSVCLGLSRYGSSQGMASLTYYSDVSQSAKPAVGGDITAVYDMVEL